jgi:hypothetical protein
MQSNITVVIPIHEVKKEEYGLLTNSIKSTFVQRTLPKEIVIVCPENIKTLVESNIPEEQVVPVRIVTHKESTDFPTQMGIAINNIETEFFCFLEFDDELSSIWIGNAEDYIKSYPDVGIFLPIVVDTDANHNFIGLSNNPAWALEFTDDHGFLDIESLKRYHNWNFDGMVMRKSDYNEIGGVKKNMELTFPLEFLLRAMNNERKIMVIPKFGYKHINQRDGSMFHQYSQTVSHDEARFWLNTAKKEYMFKLDREITYEPIT